MGEGRCWHRTLDGCQTRRSSEESGCKGQGKHVVFDGADAKGQKAKFVRSFAIEKGLDPATLLAFEMNGQPLPVSHGYPVRLVVPGWTGNHSIKWLNRISVASEPHDGPSMNEYRFPVTYVSPEPLSSGRTWK